MIRRIQRTNDLKDIIRSCPSGVIEDIHEVRYYIYGNEGKYISASLSLEGDVLVAVLPSQDLQRLSNGILYRKAFYSVADESYPDGHLDLEFVDNMNIWLGDMETMPTPPVPDDYLTPDDLKTINGQSLVGEGDIHIEGGDVDLSDYFTKEETETKIAQHILANNGRIADEYYNREAVDAKMADKADRSEIPGPFKTINGDSIIGEGNIVIQGGEGGGLTPEQEEAVNTLVNSSKGMLYTDTIDGRSIKRYDFDYGQININNVDGRVFISRYTDLYEFKDLKLNELGQVEGYYQGIYPMWSDMSGRIYNGIYIKLDLDTMRGEQANINGSYAYNGTHHNIIKGQENVYMYQYSWYNVFDEETQDFGESISYIDEKFVDNYTFMYNQIQYGDRIISIYDNQTIEMVEDNGKIYPEVIDNPFDFDSCPFTPEGKRLFYIDGIWYYMPTYPYESAYRLVGDTWEQIEIAYPDGVTPYFGGESATVYDGLIFVEYSNHFFVYNLTDEEKKVTSWAPVGSHVVDFESIQTIGGSKIFTNAIQTPGVLTDDVSSRGNDLRLFANGNINLVASNGFVNLPANTLVDGDPVASKSDTIQSRQLTSPGKMRKIYDNTSGDFNRIYSVVFNNKLYHNSYSQWIFDGETAVNAEGLFPSTYEDLSIDAKITSSRFFLMNDGNLYELVDNEFVLRQEGTGHENSYVFPYEDTLVDFQSGQKLNTSTWEWEDWVGYVNNFNNVNRTFIFNGQTYSVNDYDISIFNPDTASFETYMEYRDSAGNMLWSNGNHFIHNGHIYVYINTAWYMVDLESRIIINAADSINTNETAFMGSLNGKVYDMKDGWVNMLYNLEYTKPEVPESDGEYSLRATRSGESVTYDWNNSDAVLKTEIWTGTQAEWDALSDEEKATYMIALVR